MKKSTKMFLSVIVAVILIVLAIFRPMGFIAQIFSAQRYYNAMWGSWVESGIWMVGVLPTAISLLRMYFRHKGTSFVAFRDGEEVGRKGISAFKALLIAGDEWDRTVSLKGFSSIFTWLNIDVLEISVYNAELREWQVNLDLNPKSKPKPDSPELKKIRELEAKIDRLTELVESLI